MHLVSKSDIASYTTLFCVVCVHRLHCLLWTTAEVNQLQAGSLIIGFAGTLVGDFSPLVIRLNLCALSWFILNSHSDSASDSLQSSATLAPGNDNQISWLLSLTGFASCRSEHSSASQSGHCPQLDALIVVSHTSTVSCAA